MALESSRKYALHKFVLSLAILPSIVSARPGPLPERFPSRQIVRTGMIPSTLQTPTPSARMRHIRNLKLKRPSKRLPSINLRLGQFLEQRMSLEQCMSLSHCTRSQPLLTLIIFTEALRSRALLQPMVLHRPRLSTGSWRVRQRKLFTVPAPALQL